MCSCRMMENISWIDQVRNEEMLQSVKEERNVLQQIKRKSLTGLVTSCVANVF
jgi:hypothetical protein